MPWGLCVRIWLMQVGNWSRGGVWQTSNQETQSRVCNTMSTMLMGYSLLIVVLQQFLLQGIQVVWVTALLFPSVVKRPKRVSICWKSGENNYPRMSNTHDLYRLVMSRAACLMYSQLITTRQHPGPALKSAPLKNFQVSLMKCTTRHESRIHWASRTSPTSRNESIPVMCIGQPSNYLT